MKENNIQDNLSMSNIIEEEKNNSYIIPSPKAEKIPLKTKNNYSNVIRSIIETDPRDNEYTNKIRTNPLSLFEYMTEEIKEIELFKNFIGTCCNIIIYKEKKNEGMPKFLFPGENKFKTQSKDNNSVRRSSIWNNSLFPNGIYNEELYS